MDLTVAHLASWAIAAVSAGAVVLRPFGWPEAIWAVAGAALLIALRLLSPQDALAGVLKGADVYLFLAGMMLLSETARAFGFFDWIAVAATRRARGSALRLFVLIYAVGALVTVFLSNDATAVVLTPAVAAAARAAEARQPLPYLFVCAFIANAASFVLPISNPANLVLYGDRLPPLRIWVPQFALASIASLVATYVVLRITQRKHLRQTIAKEAPELGLGAGGRAAAFGIGATAVALLACSSFGLALGLPTFVAGLATMLLSLSVERRNPVALVREISWGVLPLVAGLFVLVEALDKTGVIASLSKDVRGLGDGAQGPAPWIVGVGLGFVTNLMNNLPAGLIAGGAARMSDAPDALRRAALIGVDLGPNLSVTGSLATILWLSALRREGQSVSAWSFLKIGVLAMPIALGAALAAALLI